jgi:hypothetical protein
MQQNRPVLKESIPLAELSAADHLFILNQHLPPGSMRKTGTHIERDRLAPRSQP